jgi:cobalamin biosynthesis Mg chelatase CobN
LENVDPTVKRVYVGTDNILKAYMVNNMSISEIKEMLALGATITDEGIIIPPEPEPETVVETEAGVQESADEAETSMEVATAESDEETAPDNSAQDKSLTENDRTESAVEERAQEKSSAPIIPISIVAVVIVAGVFFLKSRKKK